MSGSEDIRLLVEIAHMYYDDQLTQQQIARQLNMSRSLVSKLLNKARNEGIVEITIKDRKLYPYRMLENQIEQVFGLQDVVLINTKKVIFLEKESLWKQEDICQENWPIQNMWLYLPEE